jgi:hypothetical protein
LTNCLPVRSDSARTSLALDQSIVTTAHLSLGLARETLVEPGRDDQAEDAVAEELEPFVGLSAVASMGQRPFEHTGLTRRAAERIGDEGG